MTPDSHTLRLGKGRERYVGALIVRFGDTKGIDPDISRIE